MPSTKQQGVALLAVILMVALVAIVATGMASQAQFEVKRASNLIGRDQAYQLVLSAEDFGRLLLQRDWDQDQSNSPPLDHLEEPWGKFSAALPIPDLGGIQMQIDDLQGLININNLVNSDGDVIPAYRRLLENLASNLDLETINVDAIADWIDANDEPQSGNLGGAESREYEILDPPYRTPNRYIYDVSELLLVKDIDPEEFEVIRPFLSALPHGVELNVNTAPARVIQAFDTGLSLESAEAVVNERIENGGFTEIGEFFAASGFSVIDVSDPDIPFQQQGAVFSTSYFQANIKGFFDDRLMQVISLIYREPGDGSTRILSRDFSRKTEITKAAFDGAP